MKTRVCLVGTAPSWRRTPWTDPSFEIWSLNDAYALGFPRADRWYELHPLDQMWFRKKDQIRIHPGQVPKGHFIRPEGHIEWLKTQAQTIPVFLQKEPPNDWPPNARRFPLEMVEQAFGKNYWASGPSYMLAQAVLEGYTEIWITGIHLSTEAEYREQRPQFEQLMGRLLGAHIEETEQRGFRFYKGIVTIVFPSESPIMTHGWKYAYESKPVKPPNPYHEELQRTKTRKDDVLRQIVHLPVGEQKQHLVDELEDLEVIEIDCQQMLHRAMGSGTLTAQLMIPAA